MRRPPPRSAPVRGWGAPPEPYDASDGPAGPARDDGPVRRARPPATGSLDPVTLGLGALAVGFGLWVLGRRWKQVNASLDARAMSSETRELIEQAAQLAGAGGDALAEQLVHPLDALVVPALIGGILGMAAAVMMVTVGALILLRSRFAGRPGGRILLGAGGVFTLAHCADIWVGARTVSLHEEMTRRMSAAFDGVEGVGRTMVTEIERVAAAGAPSLGAYVFDAAIVLVPALLVILWGARHLEAR